MIKNLDKLIWEAEQFELCMMYALFDQNFLLYRLFAEEYKLLADFCLQLTLQY